MTDDLVMIAAFQYRYEADAVRGLLMDAGIKGIVNFAPVVIETGAFDVAVRNMNVVNEMRILASLMTLNPDK